MMVDYSDWHSMSTEDRLRKYDTLVREFFEILDRTEETDSGRVFHPTQISCCRVMDRKELEEVLLSLKQTLEESDE